MKYSNLLCAIIGLALAGCGSSPQSVDPHTGLPAKDRVMESKRGTGMVMFSKKDPEILAAVAKARRGLPYFVRRIKSRKATEVFAVKTGLKTSTGVLEHMWVEYVTYENGLFRGTLYDEPYQVPDKHDGDEVTVAEKDIEDWSIIDARSKQKEGAFSEEALKRVQEAAKNSG